MYIWIFEKQTLIQNLFGKFEFFFLTNQDGKFSVDHEIDDFFRI